MLASMNIDPDTREGVRAFCARWKVRELALFGSHVHGKARPGSDLDVLVTFLPDASWSYWDWPDMAAELQGIFHRPIDLVEKKTIVNPFMRQSILSSTQVIYANRLVGGTDRFV